MDEKRFPNASLKYVRGGLDASKTGLWPGRPANPGSRGRHRSLRVDLSRSSVRWGPECRDAEHGDFPLRSRMEIAIEKSQVVEIQ